MYEERTILNFRVCPSCFDFTFFCEHLGLAFWFELCSECHCLEKILKLPFGTLAVSTIYIWILSITLTISTSTYSRLCSRGLQGLQYYWNILRRSLQLQMDPPLHSKCFTAASSCTPMDSLIFFHRKPVT